MGRNGFVICLSKGRLLEFSAAKLNLLGKLSHSTYYKWHPSETSYINESVWKSFLGRSKAILHISHSERQADIYDECLLHAIKSLMWPRKHRLCRGCSPVLRLEASPLLASYFYVLALWRPFSLHTMFDEPLGQIKPYLTEVSQVINWTPISFIKVSAWSWDSGFIRARPRTDRFQRKPSTQRGGVCLLQRRAHLETHRRGTATRLAGQGERRQSCAGCGQLQGSRRGGGMESTHPLAH